MKVAPVTLIPSLHHFRFRFGIVVAPRVLVIESQLEEDFIVSFTKSDTLLQALNIHVKLIQQVQAWRLRSYLVS